MAIEVTCSCGRLLRARDEQAGKRCKCPGCGALVDVPDEVLDAGWLEETPLPEPADDVGFEPPPFAKRAEPPVPAPAAAPPPPASAPSIPFATAMPLPAPQRIGLRRRYWLLLLMVIPLAYLTIAGPAVSFDDQVDATIQQNPELEEDILFAVDGEGDVEALLDELPGNRFAGALHPRGSWAPWLYAILSAGMFLGLIFAASPGQAREGEVEPLHLLYAGLFTGTAGVLLLLIIQVVGLFTCCIGALYLAAMHPDAPFGASLLGFVLGVGFLEEAVKAIPIVWRLYRPTALSWRGACLWGMASGAGFGVSEGIHYSSNYYNGISTAEDYFLRFTAVAALHVLLSGACGILLHRHRKHLDAEESWDSWLLTMAAIITVPMLLHGLYNTLLKKEYELAALFIWLTCFAWLVYLIESSHKRDEALAAAVPKRAKFIQTPQGLRMLQD